MRTILYMLSALATAPAPSDVGERIFNRACVACHQADARGVPGTFPELREHLACVASIAGGREYLVRVVGVGLEGELAVAGDHFDGFMPAATTLSSAEKAAALNYLLSMSTQCRTPGDPITPDEVDAVLSEKGWTPSSLHAFRESRISPRLHQASEPPGRDSRVDAAQERAARNFSLFCRGCHTASGEAVPGLVPPLRGSVALFLQTERGRAFVSQVPGVAFAPLDDTQLAELLNWVMQTFSVTEWRYSGYRYTAAEVASYRRFALVDVKAQRARVISELETAGFNSPH